MFNGIKNYISPMKSRSPVSHWKLSALLSGAVMVLTILPGCNNGGQPPTATGEPGGGAVAPAKDVSGEKPGGGTLTATPNPVPPGKGLGKTTITWNTGGSPEGQVYSSFGGAGEKLFAEGPKGKITAPWIKSGGPNVFRLYSGKDKKKLLSSLTVTRIGAPGAGNGATGTPGGVPTGKAVISATPNPVPPGSGLGKTTITWNTGGSPEGQVYASFGGGGEKLFAEGPKGSSEAPWIQNKGNHVFTLYKGKTHQQKLASVTVNRK